MYQAFTGGLGGIALAKHGKSRAINAENPHGEKGRGGMAASHLGPSRKGSPCLRDIEPGTVVTLAEMEGPGQINHIWITVDNKTTEADCFVLRDLVIRMYWDDEETPSVESPLGDFFCCGFGRECFVNSVPVAVVPNRGFNCYFPMPFKKKAKITLENQHANKIPAFFYQVDYCLYDELPDDIAYFHAQWRRERLTEKTKDYSYKYSKAFIQKMNAMIHEEKRKAKKKRRWHILLVAAIILILNAGIVLANDDLREKVGDLIIQFFDDNIHIRSSKEIADSEEIFRQLHLGYVPKGYHILYETENPTTMYDVYYEGTNDNYITFMQGFKENVDVHITYDGTGRKKVQVNGKELYMIKDGNITSYYYEDGEYLITLSGTEKESELIKMLKSLK